MNICADCGKTFETPHFSQEPFEHFGHIGQTIEEDCPVCGSTDYTEAGYCDECGEWVDKRYLAEHAGQCSGCVEQAAKKFAEFNAALTDGNKKALNLLALQRVDDGENIFV